MAMLLNRASRPLSRKTKALNTLRKQAAWALPGQPGRPELMALPGPQALLGRPEPQALLGRPEPLRPASHLLGIRDRTGILQAARPKRGTPLRRNSDK